MAVNVYTEWGPLREIVLARCENTGPIEMDLTFRLFYNDYVGKILDRGVLEIPARFVEERRADLDAFEGVLRQLGVRVLRPRPLVEVKRFVTPEFEGLTCPVNNPRDQVLVVGDEIIETPGLMRSRYFENDLLKELFLEYFERGARWTVAPRPTMRDEAFDYSYVQAGGKNASCWETVENRPERHEIMFDGAQCMKFGRDLVMNVSTDNHRLGARWLRRHLGDRLRVHEVSITDHHIDGMFVPLRPGTLLINPSTMLDKMERLPPVLQTWDVLVLPERDDSAYSADTTFLASDNIPVNVLPIDGEKVIVFDIEGLAYSKLCRVLEQNGFEPIPIRLRHSRLFGGGAHCATLGMVRDGGPEDFFS